MAVVSGYKINLGQIMTFGKIINTNGNLEFK